MDATVADVGRHEREVSSGGGIPVPCPFDDAMPLTLDEDERVGKAERRDVFAAEVGLNLRLNAHWS